MASVLHHPICGSFHTPFRASSDDVFYKPRRRASSTASSLDGTEDCSSVSSDSGSEPSSPTHRGSASPTMGGRMLMMMAGGGRDLVALSRRRSAQDIRRHYASKLGIVQSTVPVPASRRVSCLPEGYEPVIEKLKGGQAECYGGFLKLMRRSSRVGSMKEDSPLQQVAAAATTTPVVGGSPSGAGAPEGSCCQQRAASEAGSCCGEDKAAGGQGRGKAASSTVGCMNRGSDSKDMTGQQQAATGCGCSGTATVRKGGLKRGPSTAQTGKRRIGFVEAVKVVHIPSHEDYSRRVRDQYWSSAEEIYESACRNLIEFEYEGNYFENAIEENDMILCDSGDLVHPAHYQEFMAMATPMM